MTTFPQSTPDQSASADKPRPRRMAWPADAADSGAAVALPPRGPSKLDQIEALLLRPEGASIAGMMAATGWQAHSVRGAMAGSLKKRGIAITSDKVDGVRRYRACREI